MVVLEVAVVLLLVGRRDEDVDLLRLQLEHLVAEHAAAALVDRLDVAGAVDGDDRRVDVHVACSRRRRREMILEARH